MRGKILIGLLYCSFSLSFAQEGKVTNHIYEGNEEAQNEAYIKAEKSYRKALSLAPEKATALYNLGNTHFLDIGCGKGRALCVAAYHGFNKVTGIDFSKGLCLEAEKNLTQTKLQIPKLHYKIYTNDAFYFEIPTDVDCIFLFNPFDEIIMSGVVENIIVSL